MPAVGPVSHCLSDPPFEQRSHDNFGRIRRTDGGKIQGALPFQGVDTIRDKFLHLLKQTCSGWVILFCTAEGVAAWRDSIEASHIKYKTPCVWVKPDSAPRFNGQAPAHGHEMIVTGWCGPGYSAWNGGGRRGTFEHLCNPPDRDGLHPTQKPLSLMMELVSLFTNPGDLVCDPFMGSGQTGVACIKLGRKFCGVEIDETYYHVAATKMRSALKQPDLFIEVPKLKQTKLW